MTLQMPAERTDKMQRLWLQTSILRIQRVDDHMDRNNILVMNSANEKKNVNALPRTKTKKL
jgi:hypothetical protein